MTPAATSFTALACALQRVQDAVGIGHLVQRGRALRAVAPARAGCSGLPSNFRTVSVCRSMYASSPHADSQLKQVVGTRA